MTLRNWIPQWLKNYKLGTIKPHSYHQLEVLVRLIPDDLQDMELEDIKPLHLQEFVNKFSANASKSYKDKMRGLLRGLFSSAVENELTARDPSAKLRTPITIERPRQSFTRGEVRKIVDFARDYPYRRIAIAVVTLLFTGLRRGELLGIKWEDIDNNILTVRRGVYQAGGIPIAEDYKAKTTNSLRIVPLRAEVAFLIQSLPRNGQFVFCTKHGSLWHPRNFSRDYRSFFKALRNEYPEVRSLSPHCCRHTFATISNEAHQDMCSTQRILGHSDIQTTARYTHPDLHNMQKAMGTYTDYIFSSGGEH